MTQCVEWTGQRTSKGYGRLATLTDENGKRKWWYAHRMAWTVLVGPIPDGAQVLHHCDNPPCVNTDHLYLGTVQDNVADRQRRNRQARPKGQDNSNAKLTEADVRAIRVDDRLQREIAADYGVSRSSVTLIKNGKRWGLAT